MISAPQFPVVLWILTDRFSHFEPTVCHTAITIQIHVHIHVQTNVHVCIKVYIN